MCVLMLLLLRLGAIYTRNLFSVVENIRLQKMSCVNTTFGPMAATFLEMNRFYNWIDSKNIQVRLRNKHFVQSVEINFVETCLILSAFRQKARQDRISVS